MVNAKLPHFAPLSSTALYLALSALSKGVIHQFIHNMWITGGNMVEKEELPIAQMLYIFKNIRFSIFVKE